MPQVAAGFQTTPERRANLVKLARFLWEEPIEVERFDMDHFSVLKRDGFVLEAICPSEQREVCGTVSCAIGWGPSAGVPERGEFSWWSYCDRNFIETPEDEEPGAEWCWCFDAGWAGADNTAKGAAKRILWLLLFGVPSDWLDQQAGENDLCYVSWAPTESDWQRAATP